MQNPYQKLTKKAFWSPSVAQRSPFDLEGIWTPKFRIQETTRIVTFGSCFAQHIGKALKQRDYSWLVTEEPPPGLKEAKRRSYGYETFSCRTGNIYTPTMLEQWVDWSLGYRDPEPIAWIEGEGVRDPYRPTIEPDPFESVEEMINSRDQAINSFRVAIEQADIFVFTLGLTESWHDVGGWEYPMCPGTVGGAFDPDQHHFRNLPFRELHKALARATKKMRTINPRLKILLTVSPVPLTASASGDHVLVATMRSKSVLRAVAGELVSTKKFIDYFPSYELINAPSNRGMFFEPNLRNVNRKGVDYVMDHFFASIPSPKLKPGMRRSDSQGPSGIPSDAQCDEELLSAFSGGH